MKHFIFTFLAIVLYGTLHVTCLESSQWGTTSHYHVWNNMSFNVIRTQPFVGIQNGVADDVSKKVLHVSLCYSDI